MKMMKNKIKKIMFLENVFEKSWILSETESEIKLSAVMFKTNKWYDVKFVSKDNILYLYTENNEKIGISLEGLDGKYIIQR